MILLRHPSLSYLVRQRAVPLTFLLLPLPRVLGVGAGSEVEAVGAAGRPLLDRPPDRPETTLGAVDPLFEAGVEGAECTLLNIGMKAAIPWRALS